MKCHAYGKGAMPPLPVVAAPTQPGMKYKLRFPFYLNQFVVWRQIGWRGDTPHQPPRVIEKGDTGTGVQHYYTNTPC